MENPKHVILIRSFDTELVPHKRIQECPECDGNGGFAERDWWGYTSHPCPLCQGKMVAQPAPAFAVAVFAGKEPELWTKEDYEHWVETIHDVDAPYDPDSIERHCRANFGHPKLHWQFNLRLINHPLTSL